MGKKRFEEIEAHQLDAFRIFAIEGESDRLLEIKTVAGIEYYSVSSELLKVMATEFRKLTEAPAASNTKKQVAQKRAD